MFKPGDEVRFKWRNHWMVFDYGLVTEITTTGMLRVQRPGIIIAQMYDPADLEAIPAAPMSNAPMLGGDRRHGR